MVGSCPSVGNWGNWGAHFVSVPPLKYLRLMWSAVLCLVIIVSYIFSSFMIVYDYRTNFVPVIPIRFQLVSISFKMFLKLFHTDI